MKLSEFLRKKSTMKFLLKVIIITLFFVVSYKTGLLTIENK